MSTSTAVRSSFESYLASKPNEYFKKANFYLNLMDDGVGKLGQNIAEVGQIIAERRGNAEEATKWGNAASGFIQMRDGASAIRSIPAWHKFLTGQVFWQTDSNGWRKVKHDKDGPVLIRHDELNVKWKQVQQADGSKVWSDGKQISTDGKYIEDSKGHRVGRDWMDVVMDILVLVARTLSPIRWLHSLKAVDLGKHAEAMGSVVKGIWGAVLTLNLIQAGRDLIDEVDLEVLNKKIWETIQAALDLLAIPFDFGVGSAHPVLSIVGKALNIASALSLCIKEGVYYS